MRRIRSRQFFAAILSSFAVCMSGCQRVEFDIVDSSERVGSSVGIHIHDNQSTRSEIGSDGLNAHWCNDDRISLWARNSAGEMTLDGQIFKIYGNNLSKGYFTADLSSEMPSGNYTYYVSYPVPESVNGTSAVFTIPATQDGKLSGGADIMLATPADHSALTPVPDPEDHGGLSMKMNHKVHNLMFYVPAGEDKLAGEKIEKIVVNMPHAIVGQVTADIADPAAALQMAAGSSELTLMLAEPLGESGASQRQYACAAILASGLQYGESDYLRLTAFSRTHRADFEPISLSGRCFEEGHSTPVKLLASSVSPFGLLSFSLASNNLGEPIYSAKVSLPSGLSLGDGASNEYTYAPGRNLADGETFSFTYEDLEKYRALGGQTVTITYESAHATTSETVTLPSMSSGYETTVAMNVPWLLYEDFSSIGNISSNDEYKTSSAGSKSAVSFLNGWTGARFGAEAGHSIRIACRRETALAKYPARVDSAPVNGSLKAGAILQVSFDYGANNKYGGTNLNNVGQTFQVGYVTSADAYESGDTSGVFEGENSFYVKEYTGSYTNLPNSGCVMISVDSPQDLLRICWRSDIESSAGGNNTTAWLYLDNIRVCIGN